jgi:hypothetical protein
MGRTSRTRTPGVKELFGLASGKIYEGSATTYQEEEAEVFRTQKEVNRLLESLEKTNASKT